MFTLIRMGLKGMLVTGLLVGGGVMATKHIPGLRANVYEFVNPRVKEGKLVQQLQENLHELAAQAPESVDEEYEQLLVSSQEVARELIALQGEHAGIVDGITERAAELLLGAPAPAQPIASPTASHIAGTSSTATPMSSPSITEAVTTAVPCTP